MPVVALLLAHLLHQNGVAAFASPKWSVDTDRGWIELVGYSYVGLAALLLAWLASSREGAPIHAAWALALTVLMLDDALKVHELGGRWLDARLPLPEPPGLRTQDIGELIVWAVLGVFVLLVLACGHRLSPPTARKESWRLAGLIVLLMVFAVGVDMAHIAIASFTSSPTIELATTSLEAGGEAGTMAAILAYVVHIVSHEDSSQSSGSED